MREFVAKEKGMVQVEALFVVMMWINILFFLMNIGVVMYQQMNVVVSANEAAANAAETFSMLGTDPFISQVTIEDLKERNQYRYLINEATNSIWTEEKANWYACFRVKGNEFGNATNENFETITTEFNVEAGMRVLTVSIEREYPIFILNPVVVFGMNPTHTVAAKGSAVCYDVIHDMNMVAFNQELKDKLSGFTTSQKIYKNIESLVKKIASFFQEKTEGET